MRFIIILFYPKTNFTRFISTFVIKYANLALKNNKLYPVRAKIMRYAPKTYLRDEEPIKVFLLNCDTGTGMCRYG